MLGATSCTSDYFNCLRTWPPLLRNGKPRAGRGVDARLLGTVRRTKPAGRQVTYKPSYLVESYAANRVEAVEEARERAQRVAHLRDDVEYLRTTFLPGDETVLHVFEAPSLEALRRAAEVAALVYERIVEAVERSVEPSQQKERT